MEFQPSGLTIPVHALDAPGGRALLQQADLIFVIDVMNRERRLAYGRDLLEEIAGADEPRDVASLDVEIDFDTPELDAFLAEIATLRGRHDYQGKMKDEG